MAFDATDVRFVAASKLLHNTDFFEVDLRLLFYMKRIFIFKIRIKFH